MTLQGTTAVVIGGSSGMGFAIARQLAEQVARVVIAARTKERLDKAASALGPSAEARLLDVTDAGAVGKFFDAVGEFDHLVTAASAFAMGPLTKVEMATFADYFTSKFWGQYWCARYAAPHIRPGGSITFFSGQASRHPAPGLGMASCINGAVEAMARGFAQELAPIRVNVISPGLVDTEVWEIMSAADRQRMYKEVGQRLPVRRVGKPEDIAKAALFLITCGYATGTVVEVDGGGAIAVASR